MPNVDSDGFCLARCAHDRLVRSVAAHYRNAGYEVRAALRGWPQPGIYLGWKPDVEAVKNGESRRKRLLVEVERAESLYLPHTRKQLGTMFRCVGQRLGRCKLVVETSEASLGKAALRHMGLARRISLASVDPWPAGIYG